MVFLVYLETMITWKLLLLDTFFVTLNWNAEFLSYIHLDNLKTSVSNKPSDKITKESLKLFVTSKLLKFGIFLRENYLPKSLYLFDVQFASTSVYTCPCMLKKISWNHCKQLGHFSHFNICGPSFFLSLSSCWYFPVLYFDSVLYFLIA